MTTPLPIEIDLQIKPDIVHFFDEATNTFSYLIKDPSSNACAVVDSVMDFDYPSGTIDHESADRIVQYIRENKLENQWIIETHVHADHLSAAIYIKQEVGGRIGIGDQITTVQETFANIFDEPPAFKRDGSQFDTLFADGDSYRIGNLVAYTLHTPGHTPACMSHVIGDATFVGDTLFMPDGGTARADFPGGDARTLYQSIQRLLSLPPEMRLFMCHDYPEDRSAEWMSTVAEEIESNHHVGRGRGEAEFVQMREARDANLAMPTLILPSLQINMRAGELPPARSSGKTFLKIPINLFKPTSSDTKQ